MKQKFNPKRVGVLGAGNMGMQAAMYIADLGIPVYLFDLPGKAKKAWNTAVKDGLGTMTGRQLIAPLDFIPENYPKLQKCDWILEAVYEVKPEKDKVNAVIAENLKPGAFVTTNTSGIGINDMAAGLPESFRRAYALSHFFNPIKILPLLEVCPVEGTDPDMFQAFCNFATIQLGKSVVQVKDTPNFNGNRIGGLALFLPLRLLHDGLSVLDVNRICECVIGWKPYDTWDIVGLQLAGPVGGNVYNRALNDPLRDWWNPEVPEIKILLDKGITGRKGKTGSGFLGKGEGGKVMFDFAVGDYVPAILSDFPSLTTAMAEKNPFKQMQIMLNGDDSAATFAREFFYTLVAYSAAMVGEICDDYRDIDTALKHGFNWPAGLFELAEINGLQKTLDGIQAIGRTNLVPEWFVNLAKENGHLYDIGSETYYSVPISKMVPVPTVQDGIYPHKLKKDEGNIIFANPDAVVLNTGDKVCLVTFTSRGNSVGMPTLDAINHAIDWAEKNDGGVVLGGPGPNFSSGANLFQVLQLSEGGNAETIRQLIRFGQQTVQRLRYSDCPTIAAPCGITYGGGSELCLGCDCRVTNATVSWGQTELNVGVTPGWCGLMNTLKNMQRGLQPYFLWGKDYTVKLALDLINPVWYNYSWIQISRDAYHAREMGFLSPGDKIIPAQGLGQPYVLLQAKKEVLSMLQAGYKPERPFLFNLPGPAGLARLQLQSEQGAMMDQYPVLFPLHNAKCATGAARVLTGGETCLFEGVTEDRLLELEEEVFMSVVMTPEARAYIKTVLKIK